VLTVRPDVRKAELQFAQYTAKIGQAQARERSMIKTVRLGGYVFTPTVESA
jgi:hypothetical protein